MHFSFFIARRYLLARKSHNAINIISGISVLAIATGTMALIIVLSVFNGFEDIVTRLFNSFNPDLLITPRKGKTFTIKELDIERLTKIPGVVSWSQVLQEQALLKYKSKQNIATLKGVGANYGRISHLDSSIVAGTFTLETTAGNYAVAGYGVAYLLGIDLNDPVTVIDVYFPKNPGASLMEPDNAFTAMPLRPSGIFSIQQEFDAAYVFVSLDFMKTLLGNSERLSSFEIRTSKNADIREIKNKVEELCGNRFRVQDKYQQEELLYKILRSERWAIFFILTFILMVATFNVTGSLTMLILEKKKDISVFWSMGATKRTIRRIFFSEGAMIGASGAVLGLIAGIALCLIQDHWGLVRLGDEHGAFIIRYYPVKMKFTDILAVFGTVNLISIFAAWLSVRRVTEKYLEKRILS